MRARHHEFGVVANGQRPNLTVMSIKLLNVLKLCETERDLGDMEKVVSPCHHPNT